MIGASGTTKHKHKMLTKLDMVVVALEVYLLTTLLSLNKVLATAHIESCTLSLITLLYGIRFARG